jgi:hypothetical protein
VLQAKRCGEAPLSEPERAPALFFLEVAEFDLVLNPAFSFAQRSERVVEKILPSLPASPREGARRPTFPVMSVAAHSWAKPV